MRILFITPMFPNQHNIQQGIFVWELAKEIQAAGHDVRVVSIEPILCWPFNKLKKYTREVATDEVPAYEPIIRHQVSQFPRSIGMLSMCNGWANAIKKKIAKAWPGWAPQIIHSHALIPGAVVGESVRNMWNIPHVVTSHGSDTRVQILRRRPCAAIKKILSKDVYVVGVGQAIVDSLKKNTDQQDRIRRVFNGMDISKIHTAGDDLKEKFRGRNIILGMGNIIKTKGFDLLLKGFADIAEDFNEWDVVIVGGGTEKDSLECLTKELGLHDRVYFTGPLGRIKAMEWMDLCDIFCLPSWSEGFGVVYVEAMASGKPIIGVAGQGIDPIIRDNNVGLLIEPKSSISVSQALRKLILDKELREKMGQEARKLAMEDFTWATSAENYISLYHEMLTERYGSEAS